MLSQFKLLFRRVVFSNFNIHEVMLANLLFIFGRSSAPRRSLDMIMGENGLEFIFGETVKKLVIENTEKNRRKNTHIRLKTCFSLICHWFLVVLLYFRIFLYQFSPITMTGWKLQGSRICQTSRTLNSADHPYLLRTTFYGTDQICSRLTKKTN